MIELKDFTYSYQDGDHRRILLEGADTVFEEGYFNVLTGKSGSGKTTLLYCIGGFERDFEGSLIFDGIDSKNIDMDLYRKRSIAFIFQNYNLFNNLSVLDNIRMAVEIAGREFDPSLTAETLKRLGIENSQFTKKVSILSGGEQQRVAVARALLTKKEIILADEPTGNLDEGTSKEIISFLKGLAHETGKMIITVSHDPEVIREADRVYRIEEKKVIKEQ